MICNFMIFSESVGSGACLSAGRPESAGHHAKPRRNIRRGFVALLSSPSLPRPSHQGNRTRQKKSLPCFRGGTSQKMPADYFSASAAGAASSAAAFSQAVESHFSQAVESQAAAGAAASTAVVSAASPSACFEFELPQQLTIAAAERTTMKVKIFFIL